MLFRICSAVSLDDDSPNGEGSIRRYFLGDDEDDDVETGMHLRLLGDVGLINGSKSIVLFKVAPHAMTCLWLGSGLQLIVVFYSSLLVLCQVMLYPAIIRFVED